jgi:hypothetical protein
MVRLVAAAALFVCLALAGCSASPASVNGGEDEGDSSKSALFEAKRLALAVQDDILAIVPSENVASVDRTTKSALLGCGDDYLWPGGAKVSLEGTVDAAAIVEAIADAFAGAEWTMGDSPTAAPGLSLKHTDGREFTVVFSADTTALTITTHSSCFPFEPEAGTKY